MNDADRDPVLRRAIDELQRLPETDPAAIRNIVMAAAAARVAPSDEDILIVAPRRAARRWAIGAVVAAAAIVGFVARGVWTPRSPAVQSSVVTPTSPTKPVMRDVRQSPTDFAAIPQQFVFRSTSARRVSVIGDFNEWNPIQAPMTRSADGATWSVIIPIVPGRHLYGFMVDDSQFVLDPRGPKARDPDLGTEGSVILVGRP